MTARKLSNDLLDIIEATVPDYATSRDAARWTPDAAEDEPEPEPECADRFPYWMGGRRT